MSQMGRLRDRWLPGSIVARMSLVLFVGILVAQTLGAALWARQVADDEHRRLIEVSENLGARVGQTLQFFSRLPAQYRHVVLDQLRDMGGTRFF
ncbi:MAG: two-component sensor histidine kinase, partial [Litorivicinus sp.]